jgi:hypothetical protein
MQGGGRGRSQKEREGEGAKTSEEVLEAIIAKVVGGGGGGGEEEEKTGYPFHFGSAQKGSQELFKYPRPPDPLAREFETGAQAVVRNSADLG